MPVAPELSKHPEVELDHFQKRYITISIAQKTLKQQIVLSSSHYPSYYPGASSAFLTPALLLLPPVFPYEAAPAPALSDDGLRVSSL